MWNMLQKKCLPLNCLSHTYMSEWACFCSTYMDFCKSRSDERNSGRSFCNRSAMCELVIGRRLQKTASYYLHQQCRLLSISAYCSPHLSVKHAIYELLILLMFK